MLLIAAREQFPFLFNFRLIPKKPTEHPPQILQQRSVPKSEKSTSLQPRKQRLDGNVQNSTPPGQLSNPKEQDSDQENSTLEDEDLKSSGAVNTASQDSSSSTVNTTDEDSSSSTVNTTDEDSGSGAVNTTNEDSNSGTVNTADEDSSSSTVNTTDEDSSSSIVNTTDEDSSSSTVNKTDKDSSSSTVNTTDEDSNSGAVNSFYEGKRSNSEWERLFSAEVNLNSRKPTSTTVVEDLNKRNAPSEEPTQNSTTSVRESKSQTDRRSSFYTISENVMYVYSAYYDNREPHVHPFGVVRVFSLYHVEQVTPGSTLQCQLHYKHEEGKQSSMVWKP